MNKKVLLIFILIALLLMVVAFIIRYRTKNTVQTSEVVSITGSESINIPSESTLVINGVTTDNFYNNSKHVNKQNDALLIDNADFQIVYLSNFKKFIISIKSQDFRKVLEEAEKSFLAKLNINEKSACELSVEINSPVGLGGTGQTLSKFSFCN